MTVEVVALGFSLGFYLHLLLNGINQHERCLPGRPKKITEALRAVKQNPQTMSVTSPTASAEKWWRFEEYLLSKNTEAIRPHENLSWAVRPRKPVLNLQKSSKMSHKSFCTTFYVLMWPTLTFTTVMVMLQCEGRKNLLVIQSIQAHWWSMVKVVPLLRVAWLLLQQRK